MRVPSPRRGGTGDRGGRVPGRVAQPVRAAACCLLSCSRPRRCPAPHRARRQHVGPGARSEACRRRGRRGRGGRCGRRRRRRARDDRLRAPRRPRHRGPRSLPDPGPVRTEQHLRRRRGIARAPQPPRRAGRPACRRRAPGRVRGGEAASGAGGSGHRCVHRPEERRPRPGPPRSRADRRGTGVDRREYAGHHRTRRRGPRNAPRGSGCSRAEHEPRPLVSPPRAPGRARAAERSVRPGRSG